MSESVPRDCVRDPVVEAYKAGVDRTLIRERLARTPAERAEDLRAGAVRRGAPQGRRRSPARAVTDFAGLIRALADGGVECILVGGVAATIHGLARLTRDVDVVYSDGPTISRESWRPLAPSSHISEARRADCRSTGMTTPSREASTSR